MSDSRGSAYWCSLIFVYRLVGILVLVGTPVSSMKNGVATFNTHVGNICDISSVLATFTTYKTQAHP